MDFLMQALQMLAPVVIGIATVPLYNGIKKASLKIDNLPAPFHQMSVLGVASGLTWLSGTINTQIPMDLAMFDVSSTSALLAGAMAFGIHAGRKPKGSTE